MGECCLIVVNRKNASSIDISSVLSEIENITYDVVGLATDH